MQHPIVRERVNYFFGSNFAVKKDFSSDKYEIMHGGKKCLDFEFMVDDPTDDNQMPFIKLENRTKPRPRILKVSGVFKCQGDERKGASLMRLIDRLAESIPFVEYITLMDSSNIRICDVSISLAQLKILTTGQSWYNHFGYKTKWHDANMAHNAVIINTRIDDIMSGKTLIETTGKKLFPELPTTMTVREYVQAVLDSVRPFPEKCTPEQHEKASFLKTLIFELGWMNDLKYVNWDLIKIVERRAKSRSPRSPRSPPRASPPKASKSSRSASRSPRSASRSSRSASRSPRASPPKASKASKSSRSASGGRRTRSCKRNKCKHNKRITKRK
uniref:Uncharacterized protein n=1 Tax=viral metagenome TaxID=1070528 RepID=A0A6C0I5W6_9ZZZZ